MVHSITKRPGLLGTSPGSRTVTIIRFATFHVIGLPHARCNVYYRSRPRHTDEEFDEIRNDWEHTINQLEALLAEFEGAYDQLGKDLKGFLR